MPMGLLHCKKLRVVRKGPTMRALFLRVSARTGGEGTRNKGESPSKSQSNRLHCFLTKKRIAQVALMIK